MGRPVVEPTVTRDKWFGGADRKILSHPAYAQVSIHHVSGLSDLYGSDFTHQHYVTLSIKRSELQRDLNRDWHFEKEELIEIALSEAQYATMVAAPNRQGVPCTLQMFDGKGIPGLPRRDSSRIPNEEFKEKLSETVRTLKEQRDEIEKATAGITKKLRGQILEPINKAIREIEANTPFLVQSFEEHTETNIERAKVEVNAYVTSTIHRAGLAALQGEHPMLEYGSKEAAE